MKLERHPDLKASLKKVGDEGHPLIVVDNLVKEPQRLLDYASAGDGFKSESTDFYPGVRKPLPEAYGDFVCDLVKNIFHEYGLLRGTSINTSLCALSVANTSPEKLLPIQRIPHFDTCDPNQWASVHYLCESELGGTGFFRHRQTGFESINTERSKKYQRVLEDEAVTKGLPPKQYLSGSSALFEMTHQEHAQFNRAIIYPSFLLHSGLIKFININNLARGRLTANTFIQIKNEKN